MKHLGEKCILFEGQVPIPRRRNKENLNLGPVVLLYMTWVLIPGLLPLRPQGKCDTQVATSLPSLHVPRYPSLTLKGAWTQQLRGIIYWLKGFGLLQGLWLATGNINWGCWRHLCYICMFFFIFQTDHCFCSLSESFPPTGTHQSGQQPPAQHSLQSHLLHPQPPDSQPWQKPHLPHLWRPLHWLTLHWHSHLGLQSDWETTAILLPELCNS